MCGIPYAVRTIVALYRGPLAVGLAAASPAAGTTAAMAPTAAVTTSQPRRRRIQLVFILRTALSLPFPISRLLRDRSADDPIPSNTASEVSRREWAHQGSRAGRQNQLLPSCLS